jgi:hypothetical protein
MIALAGGAFLAMAGGAQAQTPGCDKIKSLLQERTSLVSVVKSKTGGKKQMEAREACSLFGKLVSNGQSTITWAEGNKSWCQIPDQFIDGLKKDNANITKIRAQACQVAAQQKEMAKRAQQAGGMPMDDGLSGNVRIPQGAL